MKKPDRPPPATPSSLPLTWKDWNGCQEQDWPTKQKNLRLAPLDSLHNFIQWLNLFLWTHQLAWFRSIGWPEGYRYFSSGSTKYQEFCLKMFRRDLRRDQDGIEPESL